MPYGREQVYIMHDGSAVKIGRAVDVHKRRKLLQTGSSRIIRVLFSAGFGSFSASVESHMHRKFRSQGVTGEWFDLHPEDALAELVLHARCYISCPIFAYEDGLISMLKDAVAAEDAARRSTAACK
jgi:hypothetical protein